MYISLLTQSLFSQGAEYVVAAMARGFADAGHRVDVVVSAYHAECEATMKDRQPFSIGDKTSLVRLPGRRARQNIFALRRYIKTARPDVILCNAEPFMPSLAMANRLLPKSQRCKIVHVEHLSGVGLDSVGNFWAPPKTLRSRIEGALLRCYDGLFVVSTGTGEAMHRITGYPMDKIFTVFNPAVDGVAEAKMQHGPSHPWLVNKTAPVFVAAGAFCGFKNHPLLLRAFAKASAGREGRLIIFGEGGMRTDYEQLIRELNIGDKVSLPGYTDNLPAEMKAADAFVVSSNIESFSIVLVEALAAGCPVVSTDAPYGPPEILKGGKYGILVKRNDVDALAEGLTRVLDGHAIRAPEEAWRRFQIKNIVALYEKAIEKVMKS